MIKNPPRTSYRTFSASSERAMKLAKELILKHLKDNEIRHAWLARRMNMAPQVLWKRFQRKDVDTKFVYEVSKAMQHNYFADLAKEFDAEMKGTPTLEEMLNEPEMKYKGVEALLEKLIKKEIKAHKGEG